MNRKYELVYIVDCALAQEQKETINKEATEAIAKIGGKVINSKVWLEKQKFSFRIKKVFEGTYYLINFESVTSALADLRQRLKLNEQILRFLLTRAEE